MREATPLDYMILTLARQIRPNEIVFNGVNSIMPMVAIAVARQLYQVPFTYLNIVGGIDPVTDYLPRSTVDAILTKGSTAIFSNEDIYDLCARGGIDLIYLGAVQVDSQGRTNSSVIGKHAHPKVRLPGGGGAAVLTPTAKRVVIWRAEHSTRSFPAKLDFVTAAGNVDAVVSPLCVFRRKQGQLHVEEVYPTTTIDEIRQNTGFAIPDSPFAVGEQATKDELETIDSVDPHGVRFFDWH
jgi:glutaconate CoA-transferase subunit B